MSGSNRGIILALVGWLILAASPPRQSARAEHGDASQQIANTLNSIDASLKAANVPSVHDQPCDGQEENRHSDLCAQWKAADAADRAATASERALWLGLVGLFIGILTLLAARAAAKYAKEAASHTERGADQAKRQADAAAHSLEIARSQLRANFSVDETEFTWDKKAPNLGVFLKNCGATAAHEFQAAAVVTFKPKDAQPKPIEVPGEYVPTGIATQARCHLSFPIPLETEEMEALTDGEAQIDVEINAGFMDDFGERWNFYVHLLIEKGGDSLEVYSMNARNSRTSRAEVQSGEHQPKLL